MNYYQTQTSNQRLRRTNLLLRSLQSFIKQLIDMSPKIRKY